MLWLYVLLLGETGLRCESEALWLRWVDLDVADGMITVESLRKGRRNKSGKTRRVPLTRRLRAALQDHMRTFRLATYGGERTEWVFHHTRTIRNAIAGRRITSLRGAFNAAAGRAGLPPDLVQHDLRHRRATTWLREGKPMHLVSKALGHSTIQVTDSFYSHLVAEDLRVLVAENDDARIANSA